MAVTKSVFGKSPEGREISLYTLSNSKGMQAKVTDLGANLVGILVPDAQGVTADVTLGFDSVDFMTSSATFRSMYAWSGVWSGVGWGSILYMATLSGIDEQQYEAARLDGAGRLQCMWYITLPMLIPTAMTLFILDMGKVMSVGFEKAFAMQNELNRETSQVLSTYVYTQGLGEGNYSFSTAVDLFNSVINLALIVTVNAISRRVSEVSLW